MSLEDLKLKIKDELLISSVIESYIPVKRHGSSVVAVCPFHNDTKPSMNINDSKKIFKCFACGAAGDAISFVMKRENLDFVSAMKDICKRVGINFDAYQEEKKSNPKLEMAKKILNRASLIYRKIATNPGCEVYKHFLKDRKLSEETASQFSLGYAPNRNTISEYLNSIADPKEKKMAIDVALEIKLIMPDRNNPNAQYDLFRDRIMFPIWDQFGSCIGFTSRSIHDYQKPKYLNSMDSFIFNKSNILYGFHLAKNSIRQKDSVILVEGNMDLISLHHHGFDNAVAIMGVALGQQSQDRLSGLTKNYTLSLDTDNAGYMAMERINKQLAEKGIIAKYIEFSPHKDPDDFLKAEGALSLTKKLEEAICAYDAQLEKLIPESIPEVLDRKLEILNQAFALLSPLKNELSATERIVNFSRRLGLKTDSALILRSYEEFLSKTQEKPKSHYANKPIQQDSQPNFDEENSEFIPEEVLSAMALHQHEEEVVFPDENHLTKMEKLLLQEIVQLPTLLNHENMNEILALVSNDEVKKYIGKIRKIILEVDDNEYESVVLNLTNNENYSFDLREAVSSAFFNYKPKEIDPKKIRRMIFDLGIKLENEKLKLKKESITRRQKTCTSELEMTNILNELQEVLKEMQELKNKKAPKL